MAKKLHTKIFAISGLHPIRRVLSRFCAIHHNFAVFLRRQGWMSQVGAVEGCGSAPGMVLFERVHDLHAVNRSRILHIFGKDYAASGLFGGPKDQSVPEGKAMEAVEVDCGENVGDLGCGDVELGEQFHLAACDARVNAQFLRDRDEILLKDLHRHNSGPGAPMLGYEIDGPALFCRRRLVVCIDEDVGVEEATNAHESRPD
jgi:hypothetical protein